MPSLGAELLSQKRASTQSELDFQLGQEKRLKEAIAALPSIVAGLKSDIAALDADLARLSQ